MITKEFLTKLDHNADGAFHTTKNRGILASVLSEYREYPKLLPKENYIYFNQGKTGYCWLTAALFCISQYLKNNCGITYPAFSKTYLIFYDKLEKANKFLEFIIEHSLVSMNDREITYILNNVMTDKGQWNMAENIITKYGLIPYHLMTDIVLETNLSELNACLAYLLKYYAIRIQKICQSGMEAHYINSEKEKALSQTYKMLVFCFGKPPEKLLVPSEFVKSSAYLSPSDFFNRYIRFPFKNYSSICCNGKENYINYEVELDGNIVEGNRNTFFSLPDDIFDLMVESQIKEAHFCWYSCDAGKFYLKNRRLFDESLFNLGDIIGTDDYKSLKSLTRKEIYQYHMAMPTHAMVFTDKIKENGKNYFITYDTSANSELGAYCSTSESWFRKYVFQAVVENKYLGDFLEVMQSNVKLVKPWEFFPTG